MGEMADYYLAQDLDDPRFYDDDACQEPKPQVCNRCKVGPLFWGRWKYSDHPDHWLHKLYTIKGELHNCIGFKRTGFKIIPFAEACNYGNKLVHVVGWAPGGTYIVRAAFRNVDGAEVYVLESPKTHKRFSTRNPLYYTKNNETL